MKKYWYRLRNRLHEKFLIRLKLKFVTWFHARHPGRYCWADCVSWAFSPTRFDPYGIEGTRGCEVESTVHEFKTCYCGSWNNGVCFERLSKEEQEKVRAEFAAVHADELPF